MMLFFHLLLFVSATAGILPTARGDPDAERTAYAQRGQCLGFLLINTDEFGCKLVMGDNIFSKI